MTNDLIVKIKAPNGAELKVQTGLFINNEFVKGDITIDTVNPTTGEVICTVQAAEAKLADEVVAIAEKAYKEVWSKKSVIDRQKLLFKLADLIERDIGEIAMLASMDSGKPYQFAAKFDIPAMIGLIRYYAGYTNKVYGKIIDAPAACNFVELQHAGVTVGILPWNFSAALLGAEIARSLAAGNVLIVKVSEITPLLALKVASLVVEAGFPPGVLQIINGYGKTAGSALARHMRIGKLNFTDSVLASREIMNSLTESTLKNMSMDFHGNSSNIVFDDADIDQAVKWAHRTIFSNSDQACTHGSRIYVAEGIYDKFLAELTAAANNGMVNDLFETKTAHGHHASQTHYDRMLMHYLENDKANCARIHHGINCATDRGYIMESTTVTNAHGTKKIVQEEIFGPVAYVTKFKNEDDVIKRANATIHEYAAAVHTRDVHRAIRIAKQLQGRTVWINQHNILENVTPCDCYKTKCVGYELSETGLKNYLDIKSVKVNLSSKL